ncbi:hypothetical protein CR970_01125 [Candidatus Saccharibacteria bacterium]|nr:MAG: hypothetical protein CR970_01125 [Candidatus Saccharibacteria bacterium]
MKNRIRTLLRQSGLALAGIVAAFSLVAAAVPSVALADSKADVCEGVGLADGGSGCSEGSGPNVESAVKLAIQLLSYIAGVASVIMIIVAGLRYITSNGDPSGIKGAKDAIVYAIVGLIVVVISQSIVRLVLSEIK